MHKKQKNFSAYRNSVSPKQMENDSVVINGWYKHHVEIPNESKHVMSGWYQGRLQESPQHSSAKMHPHFLLTWTHFVKRPLPYPISWAVGYELPSREILGWEKKEIIINWSVVMETRLIEGDGHWTMRRDIKHYRKGRKTTIDIGIF